MFPIQTLQGKLAGIDPNQTRLAFEPEGAKKAFYTRLSDLPKDAISKIEAGTLHVVPGTIIQCKPVAQVTKMFESSDQKKTATISLAAQKIDAGKFFLPTSIQVLVGTPSTASQEDFFNTEWGGIETINNCVAGEFEFSIGKETLVPERTSMEVFATSGKTTVRPGEWPLDDPKWLFQNLEIDFDITLGDTSNVPALSYFKLVLHGLWLTN